MRKLGVIFLTLFLFSVVTIAQTADTTQRRVDSISVASAREVAADNIASVSLDDDLADAGGQSVSSVLTGGRDPYLSAASFNFSAVRFRIRGYDADEFGAYLNGLSMDNLDNGFTPFFLWGGLNDVTRLRDQSFGLKYNTFAFGELGMATNIDIRASKQRKQTEIEYDLSNRNYTHKLAVTYGSGITKKGWAFSLSGSRRYADEGYVPGTYYNGWSYFAAVDKRLNQKNLLSLAVFGAPTESGRQAAATAESFDLAGTNYYNPSWGYQDGKKRNANVAKSHQPVAILSHDLRLNNNTDLLTTAGYSFGDRTVTALDWYNAADPRPDYYRYLPSYTSTYASSPDPVQGDALYKLMSNDINYRQIDWQHLYDVNRDSYSTIQDANGDTGSTVSGHRSRYILEDRVINTKRFNLTTVLNTRFGKNIDFTAGASFQNQKNHYYKKVNDLLGGEFYVNINQFAERDFQNDNVANQNDADHPNRILYEGDKFGYDYDINVNKVSGWAQAVFKYSKIDFFLAGQISHTSYWRTGNVRNGVYPDSSLGKGAVNNFTNYALKGGLTYKINGRNYLYVNLATLTRAPYFDNVYLSPRTRDSRQNTIESEFTQSAEGGYIMNAPRVKIRIGGYYTHFTNQMDVTPFYYDALNTFVNFATTNIDKLHFGGEFGIEARIAPGVTVNAAAAIGRYYYDSKQYATITPDNGKSNPSVQTVYAKNFRIPSTPMEAYSAGIAYRSPKFWFVTLTANYFDQSYLAISPIRRTDSTLNDLIKGTPEYDEMFNQTKFDGQFTLDFFGSYSWKLPKSMSIKHKNTFFVLNAGVNNLLNNKDIITGGYEQLRIDSRYNAVGKFPPKLYYAYGINYFVSATLRF